MMDCRRAARALLVPVVRSARTVACRVMVLALAMTLAGCGRPSTPTDGERTTVLRWGGDAEGGAPYVEADPAHPDSMRGFDVEIAEMIAKGLGRTPRFVQVAFASIDASVERGDFDVGLSGVEDRPELHERHSPSLPYFEFREVLAVRGADSARYRSLDDLAGGGTLAVSCLAEQRRARGWSPSPRRRRAPVTPVEGRLDAVLLDHIIAERSFKRIGGFHQPDAFARPLHRHLQAGDSALRDSANGPSSYSWRRFARRRSGGGTSGRGAAASFTCSPFAAATRPEPRRFGIEHRAHPLPSCARPHLVSCWPCCCVVSLGGGVRPGTPVLLPAFVSFPYTDACLGLLA
jgi:hypothetical protein